MKKIISVIMLGLLFTFVLTNNINIHQDITNYQDESILSQDNPYYDDDDLKYLNSDQLYDDNEKYDQSSIIIKLRKTSLSDEKNPQISHEMRDLGVDSLTFLLDATTPDKEDSGIWFEASLNEGVDSKEIISALSHLDEVEKVELNYVYQNETIDFPKVIENPRLFEQWYLEAVNTQAAWEHLETEGYDAGGLSSVVIAVIDTGVDYNHKDLKGNMWININEIPNNGIDDDSNGFIDDIHGVNVVSDERFHSGDPMDDHGHGTHVAGIAAASNNKEGIVGIAYNAKIMAIKAGNASGYFLQTDIAEAILYAYEQGADVINMSFGGRGVSFLVQEALSVAYTRSVLVAAAGNDGMPNQPCPLGAPIFPAAYPYVIGVMSTNPSNGISSFSNTDCISYNAIEYDVFAPGEGILSTLPNDRYAAWSGTSMAAPIVSGIAALLRTYYDDYEVYTNKYIMGQIIATGSYDIRNYKLVDAYLALTTSPKPMLNFYDFYGFDSETIDINNNGDSILDAGELLDLGIIIKNRWGMADNVNVKIDAISTGGIPNPYLDFLIDTVYYGGVGTLSSDDNGVIIEYEEVTGISNPFKIRIDPNTPNDMKFDINVTITYSNALDENDTTTYISISKFTIEIRNGTVLPALIDTDLILTKDRYYIISKPTLIEQGVTVNIEPGTTIYFKNSVNTATGALNESLLNVRGTLIANGTKNEMIKFEAGENQIVDLKQSSGGIIDLSYAEIENPQINVNTVSYAYFYQSEQEVYIVNQSKDGLKQIGLQIIARNINNSKFVNFASLNSFFDCIVSAELENNIFDSSNIRFILGLDYFSIPDKYYQGYAQSANIVSIGYATNNLFLNNGKFVYNKNNINGGIYRPSYLLLGNQINNVFNDNVILNNYQVSLLQSALHLYAYHHNTSNFTNYGRLDPQTNYDYSNVTIDIESNYWGQSSNNLIDSTIHDFFDNFYSEKVSYINSANILGKENMFPFVQKAYILNSENEEVFTVGKETVTFVVEFSRDMDTTIPLDFRFGSSMPFAEFKVEGVYVSPTKWEGIHTFNTIIENGFQYMNISNGASSLDSWFTLGHDVGRFVFEIDVTAAQALIMQGSADEGGIHLNWVQEDFETLAGYNVYRSTSEDGLYHRLNDFVIPYDVKEFYDQTVEPGVTYYYNFTVVKTDLSESVPSGKISIQSLDTMAPTIYHTPIYQGVINQNLLIKALVVDNISIRYVKVYYKTIGENQWNVLNMTQNNNQYLAVIPQQVLSLDGFEYYIEANDGITSTFFGSDTNAYQVTIKNAIDESAFGDVNGDGIINVLDALLILQAINDKINLTSDEFMRADLNKNGQLEAFEALKILLYVTGNNTTLR
jgi:subtilisin family serine protease